jgi:hypothetical protein
MERVSPGKQACPRVNNVVLLGHLQPICTLPRKDYSIQLESAISETALPLKTYLDENEDSAVTRARAAGFEIMTDWIPGA